LTPALEPQFGPARLLPSSMTTGAALRLPLQPAGQPRFCEPSAFPLTPFRYPDRPSQCGMA
jgi:hypothetical protein